MRYFAGIVVLNPKGQILALHKIGKPGMWLPGGKIENESPLEAAVRELYEETGLRAVNMKRMHVSEPWTVDGTDWQGHIFLADGVWDHPQLKEPDKFDMLGWMDVEAFMAQSPRIANEVAWLLNKPVASGG